MQNTYHAIILLRSFVLSNSVHSFIIHCFVFVRREGGGELKRYFSSHLVNTLQSSYIVHFGRIRLFLADSPTYLQLHISRSSHLSFIFHHHLIFLDHNSDHCDTHSLCSIYLSMKNYLVTTYSILKSS